MFISIQPRSPAPGATQSITNLAKIFLGDFKSSPNSDEFGKVGLGEEFKLRYVLTPFKYVSGSSGFGPGGFINWGGFVLGEGII